MKNKDKDKDKDKAKGSSSSTYRDNDLTLVVLNFYPSVLSKLNLSIRICNNKQELITEAELRENQNLKMNSESCLNDQTLIIKFISNGNSLAKGSFKLNTLFSKITKKLHYTVSLKLTEYGKKIITSNYFGKSSSLSNEIKINFFLHTVNPRLSSSIESKIGLYKNMSFSNKPMYAKSSSIGNLQINNLSLSSVENATIDKSGIEKSSRNQKIKIQLNQRIDIATTSINNLNNKKNDINDSQLQQIKQKRKEDDLEESFALNPITDDHLYLEQMQQVVESSIDSLSILINSEENSNIVTNSFSCKEIYYLSVNEINQQTLSVNKILFNSLSFLLLKLKEQLIVSRRLNQQKSRLEILDFKAERLKIKVNKLQKKQKFQEDNDNGPITFSSLYNQIVSKQSDFNSVFFNYQSYYSNIGNTILFLCNLLKKLFGIIDLTKLKEKSNEETLYLISYLIRKFDLIPFISDQVNPSAANPDNQDTCTANN